MGERAGAATAAQDHEQMTDLRIADDLTLPADLVTQAVAIVGRRGSGKTTTGVVLVEELIRTGLPVVVLDPLGVWWGLRADASGDGEGLPVVIFGGDHADVPLQPGTGALVADVIVDERPPAVIDLSGLDSDAEIRRWCTAFLKRLYQRNRSALHVVIDEADLFAPQQGSGEAAQSTGAMKSVFRRGRVRGLGGTLITQRPAALSKEVLNQAEVLVAMQLTGPRDVAAVEEWMSQAGDAATVRDVKDSLPGLVTGESWWWSPAWLRMLQRVQVRPRETFDSSATPKPGEQRAVPDRMAAVDLARISDAMAEVVEQAELDEPARLRARIRDLEKNRLAGEPERVEVKILPDEQVEALAEQVRAMRETGTQLIAAADGIEARLAAYRSSPRPDPASARAPAPRPHERASRPSTAAPGPAAGDGPAKLPRAQTALLHVLVREARALTHTQLAILSGYSSKSGGYKNALGALRSAGLIVGGRDAIAVTDSGVTAAGTVPPKPSGPDLVRHWTDFLPKAEGVLLLCLLDAWPSPMSADDLAEVSGYSRTSGGFKNALGKLRTLELAAGGAAAITANDELGEAHRRSLLAAAARGYHDTEEGWARG